MDCVQAPDVELMAKYLLEAGIVTGVDLDKVRFVRSRGSRSRSYARIFLVPKPMRAALDTGVTYVVEVNSRFFDPLTDSERLKVVVHELAHIPSGGNGSLRTHRSRPFKASSKADSSVLAAGYRRWVATSRTQK